VLAYATMSRIIDFGNGGPSDNIFLALSYSVSDICTKIYNGTVSYSFTCTSSPLIQLNTWYHIANVFSGTTSYIYVNGNLVSSGTQYVPKNVIRNKNYFGKSNWANSNVNASFDDLRIYNGALSAEQILNDYTLSSNNGIVF
jgi:hypothetical protein